VLNRSYIEFFDGIQLSFRNCYLLKINNDEVKKQKKMERLEELQELKKIKHLLMDSEL
jgi:hypothetical protein